MKQINRPHKIEDRGWFLFLQLKNLSESPIREKEGGLELVSKGLTRSIKNISHCESCYRYTGPVSR
jgi:hypothetical protein